MKCDKHYFWMRGSLYWGNRHEAKRIYTPHGNTPQTQEWNYETQENEQERESKVLHSNGQQNTLA